MTKENEKKMNKFIITILIIIILIILYLLILQFGNLEHRGLQVPTGNVDIFEINGACKDDNNKPSCPFNPETDDFDLTVYDDDKVYDGKTLRIFENPAYEFKEVIAPGSENSYAFVIKNNNDYDIVVDIDMVEKNVYSFNMVYKLKSKSKYLIGSEDKYVSPEELKLRNVEIKANGSISYVLDWRWEHSKKDTKVGINDESAYSLKIQVKAREK